MKPIFAFACRTHGAPQWGETVYNSTSAGKAKHEHWRMVSDPWPDVKFTDIRCRKIGPVRTSEDFIRNARYRGMPDLKCGQRVSVNGQFGYVVGHNSSANFDVLFDDDSPRYGGMTLNVHPSELQLVPAQNSAEPSKP